MPIKPPAVESGLEAVQKLDHSAFLLYGNSRAHWQGDMQTLNRPHDMYVWAAIEPMQRTQSDPIVHQQRGWGGGHTESVGKCYYIKQTKRFGYIPYSNPLCKV